LGCVPIARAANVELWACGKWLASFFSSPFYPHITARAVDVSTSLEFGGEALSPVEGVVERLYRVEAGPGPFSRTDYVIMVRCGSLWVKIMHVEPSVRIGEKLGVGDFIGRFVRTNFLAPRNLPHMHLEVCRARSGRPGASLSLEPTEELLSLARSRPLDAVSRNFARCRPVHVSRDYSVLDCESSTCVEGLCRGARVAINADLHEPHMYVGLIHLEGRPRPNSLAKVFGAPVGIVRRVLRGFSIAPNSPLPYRRWIAEVTSLSSLASQPRASRTVFAVDAFVNGSRTSLEVLVGSFASMKVSRAVEASRVELCLVPRSTASP